MNHWLAITLLCLLLLAALAMIGSVARDIWREMAGPDDDEEIRKQMEDWRDGK
jgi:hypothetical protein